MNIDDILDSFGFCKSPYSAEEEKGAGSFQGKYKNWEIYFSVPNGGITAAIIVRNELAYNFIVGDSDEDWEYHFDYLDSEGVLSHVKKTIDAVEGTSNQLIGINKMDDSQVGQVIGLLERIAIALETKTEKPARQGLGKNFAPKTLVVGRVGNACWSLSNGGDELAPVEDNEVCGVIQGIFIKDVNSNEWGDVRRLHLTMATPECPYIVDVGCSTGKETVFAKNLLWGLNQATPEQLSNPIVIRVRPSVETSQKALKIVFCEMYDYKSQQIPTIFQECDWEELLLSAFVKINQANVEDKAVRRSLIEGIAAIAPKFGGLDAVKQRFGFNKSAELSTSRLQEIMEELKKG